MGLCVSGILRRSPARSWPVSEELRYQCGHRHGDHRLASLIIGETLLGKRTMLRRIIGVVFGSCLYRFIVAVALRFNVPAAAMKLVTAIIVAVAISMPSHPGSGRL